MPKFVKLTLIPMLPGLILGFMVLLALIGGLSSSSKTGGGDVGSVSFPPLVERWRSDVVKACKEAGIPDEVNTILALINQESGGRAEQYPDILQCSESQGRPPNSISDPIESINVGTKYFASLLGTGEKKTDRLNAVQSYNYGGGFLGYAGEKYTLQKAIDFAGKQAGGAKVMTTSPVAIENGYTWRYAYGNMFYAKEVEKFLNSVGSGSLSGDWGWPFPAVGQGSFGGAQIFGVNPGGEFRPNGFHDGLDFGSIDHPGIEMHAVHGGKVTFVGNPNMSGLGNLVIVISDGGYNFVYQEFSAGAGNSRVKEGDTVKAGQVIGMRDTSHLHLGITKINWIEAQGHAFSDDGTWLDPLDMILSGMKNSKGD